MSKDIDKGLTHREQITQKKPREETKTGQRPKGTKESTSDERGKFTFKY